MIDPVFELPWWGYVVICLGLTHVTIVSVTIFLHRSQSHLALDLHPALSHFFRFWLWLTTGIKTKEWVAIHRKHHSTVESEDDPHSPQVAGINAVLWGGLFLYQKAAKQPGILEKYGKGTPNDWLEHNVYARFANTGLAIMLIANVVLFGWVAGISIWAVQMIWIPFWAAGVINGVGHYFGYRNFELDDASRNIVPLGIIIGGEELHNNHHAYASSAQFSTRKWEIDLGWQYIRLLSKLGLVKVRRKIPVTMFKKNKNSCDVETVRFFVTNRYEVISKYVREVVHRVHREEIRAASGDSRKMMKKAKRLLETQRAKLSFSNQQRLQRFLDSNQRLKKVYQMKEALHNISTRSTTSYESLCKALDDWCKKAEESEISALMQFSIQLKRSVST